MTESNQLGLPESNTTDIFLRQGATYTKVGNLTKLSAKAKSENEAGETDYGGGLFSMTLTIKLIQILTKARFMPSISHSVNIRTKLS